MKWTKIDWDDESTWPPIRRRVLICYESISFPHETRTKSYICGTRTPFGEDVLLPFKARLDTELNGEEILAWKPIEEYEE